MGSQFIRLETYGRAPRAGVGKWRNVEGILGEASRIPTATPHVDRPIAPFIAFGCDPIDLVSQAIGLANKARDTRGRCLRKDGAVLLAGVISYPMPVSECRKDQQTTDQFRDWGRDARAWLRDRFGQNLKSIVVHVDETHPHLHFFALPDLMPDNRLDWSIHPGLSAKRKAASKKASKKAQDAAYRLAMRVFQDEFWNAVSKHHGHARVGPQRPRVARHVHLGTERLKRDLDVALSELAELKGTPKPRN